MTHTPGPWEYDGKFQVGIPHKDGWTGFRTNPEDARLIAAAPDMLAALKEIVALDGRMSMATLVKAAAAVAKAEGKR
jgi:hypothetical protein